MEIKFEKYKNQLDLSGYLFPGNVRILLERHENSLIINQGIFFGKVELSIHSHSNKCGLIECIFFDDLKLSIRNNGFSSSKYSPISFDKSTFNENVNLDADTSIELSFRNSNFEKGVLVQKNGKLGGLDCFSTKFADSLNMAGTEIAGRVSFQSSTIYKSYDLSNCDFYGPISFRKARFVGTDAEPPNIFRSIIHEDFDISDVHWPSPPSREKASNHRRYYERLRSLMDERKRIHDEYLFLRKEFRAREVETAEGKIISRLYGAASDYGWSVKTPIVLMACVWFLGTLGIVWNQIYRLGCAIITSSDGTPGWTKIELPDQRYFWDVGEAAAMSFASMFGFLGIGSSILRDEFNQLSGVSAIVPGIEMALGPIFLFLLLLAIRNRFRMR